MAPHRQRCWMQGSAWSEASWRCLTLAVDCGSKTRCACRSSLAGLPDRIPLRRVHGTDLWHLVLELPAGSRVEYQIEIRRGEHWERFNDPLNPRLSHSPVGSSSVCFGPGYEPPDWVLPDPEARPGELRELVIPSRALKRDARVSLYLPARFRPTASYPLLIVHDG